MKRTAIRMSLAVLMATMLMATTAHAQRLSAIYGTVENMLTREPLVGAKVTLARADSTTIDTTSVLSGIGVLDRENVFLFRYAPKEGGHWLLHVEQEGYEPAWFPIHVPKFTLRRPVFFAGDLKLQRKMERQLGEVTVKATKLKFYHHGDTLVYNADAFRLAEGSMLDALIRQLPGAELKDDGRILVNGRKIESLTLNGEDFFRGNNRVMLDNLPAYTVSKVQVYDKGGKLSQLAGRRMGDEAYTMDVRLKKEYEVGWLGNVEGGAGSKERWLARLFAMRFTPHSRLTVYGNANNLNDNRKPGENTEWTMDKMPRGLLTTRTADADYLVSDRRKRYKLSGNAQFSHSDTDNQQTASTENFLATTSSWKRAASSTLAHDLSLSTSHEWELHLGQHSTLTLKPYLSYDKWRNRSSSAAASLTQDLIGTSLDAFIDSIRRTSVSTTLAAAVSNRQLRESLGSGHSVGTGLSAESQFQMPGLPDFAEATASVHYNNAHADLFDNRLTDYPASGSTADFRRRWDRTRPDHGWRYDAAATYYICLPINMVIAPGYAIAQKFSRSLQDIYRLDSLGGWGYGTDHPLGSRPEDGAQLAAIADTWNSCHMRSNNLDQTPRLAINWQDLGDKEGQGWWMNAEIPFEVQRHRLHYRRATFDGLVRRNAFFVSPSADFHRTWSGNRRGIDVEYSFRSSMPSLADLIELDNTLDPVNLRTGNASLGNTHRHSFSARYHFNDTPSQTSFSAGANASLTDGLVTDSYMYDPTRGTYRFQPVNVSGVKLVSAFVNYATPLTKDKHLSISTYTYGQLQRRPDMTGVVGEDERPVKSTVNSYWVTEDLRLRGQAGIFTAEASGYLSWNRASGSWRTGSTIYDYHYGLDLQAQLPMDISISTDLKMYSRRGYTIASLNDDNLVWNFRLAKAFPKAGVTLACDAFDVLGRLSNVSQILTSSLHSETRYNAIPRYVMFHAIYKFHVNPRKR